MDATMNPKMRTAQSKLTDGLLPPIQFAFQVVHPGFHSRHSLRRRLPIRFEAAGQIEDVRRVIAQTFVHLRLRVNNLCVLRFDGVPRGGRIRMGRGWHGLPALPEALPDSCPCGGQFAQRVGWGLPKGGHGWHILDGHHPVTVLVQPEADGVPVELAFILPFVPPMGEADATRQNGGHGYQKHRE